jgi:hypothetical protein
VQHRDRMLTILENLNANQLEMKTRLDHFATVEERIGERISQLAKLSSSADSKLEMQEQAKVATVVVPEWGNQSKSIKEGS